MNEQGPASPVQETVHRRRGCLIPALLTLLAVLALPCCLLAIVLVGAAGPAGFAIGSAELGFTAELRVDHFIARLTFQTFEPDRPCYHEENLTILFNPLQVRRVPGCQCAVAGPDHSYRLEPCWPD